MDNMKKRADNRKIRIYLFILLGFLVATLFFVLYSSINNINILYSPNEEFSIISKVGNVSYPKNCSSQEINNSWSSIFRTALNESDVILSAENESETGCERFFIYKKDNLDSVLIGESFNIMYPFGNDLNPRGIYKLFAILAANGNFTAEFKNNLSSIRNINDLYRLPVSGEFNETTNLSLLRNLSLTSHVLVLLNLRYYYVIFPPSVKSQSFGNYTLLSFNYNTSSQGILWEINSNYSFSRISAYKLSCINNNWTRLQTLCKQNGTDPVNGIKEIYYADANCGANPYDYGKFNKTESCIFCQPNWTNVNTACLSGDKQIIYSIQNGTNCNVSAPKNITLRCDFDNNNIIGNFSEVTAENIVLSYRINSAAINYTLAYSGEKKVEFSDLSNNTRVYFNFTFNSTNKLKPYTIDIKKQPANNAYGYLIVNGLDGIYKTFVIDKINLSSNKVCIKDRNIANADAFSARCNGNDEKLAVCNNSLQFGYSCGSNGSYYIVRGLMNTGVREYFEPPATLTPNPVPTPTLTPNPVPTIPSTNITPFTPDNPSSIGNPVGGASDKSSIIFWVITGVLSLAIVIVAILLILSLTKSNEQQNNSSFGMITGNIGQKTITKKY